MRPWQAQAERLEVVYLFESGDCPELCAAISDASGATIRIDLNSPVELVPVTVTKPWGREIWYSGIEARGESRIKTGQHTLPLFSYLSLAPAHLCGRRPLVLLKALESKPAPLSGELYFETHRDKQEVYIVTDVDPTAHPDGVGRVRLGVNQQLRSGYGNDAAFRDAFTRAAEAYERARHAADQNIDAAGAPSADEIEARAAVLAFTAEHELRVGDVISVPAGVPHALQHGIRVLEFQTPSFERRIIYAAQKVLTQQFWDSAAAIAAMSLEPPPPPSPLLTGEPTRRVACFPQFSVSRTQLGPGHKLPLAETGTYALITALFNPIQIDHDRGSLPLHPGHAAFVPASATGVALSARQPATVLIARPEN